MIKDSREILLKSIVFTLTHTSVLTSIPSSNQEESLIKESLLLDVCGSVYMLLSVLMIYTSKIPQSYPESKKKIKYFYWGNICYVYYTK